MNKKKYNIIYADPPWLFKTYSEKGKEMIVQLHYNAILKYIEKI